jgi:hypothetical protein
VIIRWIEGGLKESPEQMAQYFDDMIADSRRRGEEEQKRSLPGQAKL